LPIQVVRGLSLPGSVGPETFVALCSSSGNTEETLALYEDARARDAMILAITRGGELAQRCDRDGSPWWRVRYDSPPRAATVQTLAPLLQLGVRLGACAGDDERIARAAHAHRAFVRRNRTGEGFDTNEAKQLAERLHGRIPIVVAAEHLAPAAVRFKNQLAENGKMLASAETLPEAGHNLVVGLGTAAGLPASLVTLESASLSDRRLRRRFDGLCEQFAETGLPVHRISIDECSPLAELLVATAWGDWVSCYAGLLNGFDPTPIPQIESMRRAAAG
jgi:glucose/mannose-6-phosphate isomerase